MVLSAQHKILSLLTIITKGDLGSRRPLAADGCGSGQSKEDSQWESLSQADTSAQKEGGLLAVGWGGREEEGAHRPGVNYSPTTGEQALWLFHRPDEENCWPFSTGQDYCDHLVQKHPQDTARLHWGAPPALHLSCVAIIPLLPLFSSDPKTESQRGGRQERNRKTERNLPMCRLSSKTCLVIQEHRERD